MDGWKREEGPRPGRGRLLRPGLSLPPLFRRVALTATVAIALGLGPVAEPVRAGTDCGASMRPAEKTPEGLPRDSGEASGVVSSRHYPGVAWMIRDSGHPASLYALRFGADGIATSREIPVVGATNRDWEEITYATGPDGTGRLWVIESGQGGGSGGRVIYEIVEPDPDTATSVKPSARYSYAYPDRSTNTEAGFTWDNHLVLVTKNFPGRIYRFGDLSTGGVNTPVYVGELVDSNGISVAKPSPDGRWLASATHDTVYLYRNAGAPGTLEGFTNQEPFHVLVSAPDDNVEAGDFYPAGECQLLLLSETRNTYRLASE